MITKLVDAFSAVTPDGRPPAHLAAEMAKNSNDLFDHMRNKGCVYVCGGATVSISLLSNRNIMQSTVNPNRDLVHLSLTCLKHMCSKASVSCSL